MPCGLRVRLYAKPGCHLCEDAEAVLEALRSRYTFILERIDISTDAELTRRYWDVIPVLVVEDREHPAPLSRGVIEAALNAASSPLQSARSIPPHPSRPGEASIER
jgi:hypothetical protein